MTAILQSSARISPSPEVLSEIKQQECSLAIWQRDRLGGIAQIMAPQARDIRFNTLIPELPERFDQALSQAGFADHPVRTGLIEAEDAERVRNGLAPRQINSLSAGDVGIFKGKLGWGEPIVHRSPPIAGSGERRLFLVLNPAEGD